MVSLQFTCDGCGAAAEGSSLSWPAFHALPSGWSNEGAELFFCPVCDAARFTPFTAEEIPGVLADLAQHFSGLEQLPFTRRLIATLRQLVPIEDDGAVSPRTRRVIEALLATPGTDEALYENGVRIDLSESAERMP